MEKNPKPPIVEFLELYKYSAEAVSIAIANIPAFSLEEVVNVYKQVKVWNKMLDKTLQKQIKIAFTKSTLEQKIEACLLLWEQTIGQALFKKLPLKKLTAPQLVEFYKLAWRKLERTTDQPHPMLGSIEEMLHCVMKKTDEMELRELCAKLSLGYRGGNVDEKIYRLVFKSGKMNPKWMDMIIRQNLVHRTHEVKMYSLELIDALIQASNTTVSEILDYYAVWEKKLNGYDCNKLLSAIIQHKTPTFGELMKMKPLYSTYSMNERSFGSEFEKTLEQHFKDPTISFEEKVAFCKTMEEPSVWSRLHKYGNLDLGKLLDILPDTNWNLKEKWEALLPHINELPMDTLMHYYAQLLPSGYHKRTKREQEIFQIVEKHTIEILSQCSLDGLQAHLWYYNVRAKLLPVFKEKLLSMMKELPTEQLIDLIKRWYENTKTNDDYYREYSNQVCFYLAGEVLLSLDQFPQISAQDAQMLCQAIDTQEMVTYIFKSDILKESEILELCKSDANRNKKLYYKCAVSTLSLETVATHFGLFVPAENPQK